MKSISAADVVRASFIFALVAMTTLAQPEARKLRNDPLRALENSDLLELLDMDLDEQFLVPQTMFQNDALPPAKTNIDTHVNQGLPPGSDGINQMQHRHRQRSLQEEGGPSPTPMLISPEATASSTGGGTTSSDGSSSMYYSPGFTGPPSATPTAAPTMGFADREFTFDTASPTASPRGLFGSASPTAAPSALFRSVDLGDDDASDIPREVAGAASKYVGPGGRGGGGPVGVSSAGLTAAAAAATAVAAVAAAGRLLVLP